MPTGSKIKMRKLPKKDLYKVFNTETKKVYSKGSTKEDALKQIALLKAEEAKEKNEVNNVSLVIEEEIPNLKCKCADLRKFLKDNFKVKGLSKMKKGDLIKKLVSVSKQEKELTGGSKASGFIQAMIAKKKAKKEGKKTFTRAKRDRKGNKVEGKTVVKKVGVSGKDKGKMKYQKIDLISKNIIDKLPIATKNKKKLHKYTDKYVPKKIAPKHSKKTKNTNVVKLPAIENGMPEDLTEQQKKQYIYDRQRVRYAVVDDLVNRVEPEDKLPLYKEDKFRETLGRQNQPQPYDPVYVFGTLIEDQGILERMTDFKRMEPAKFYEKYGDNVQALMDIMDLFIVSVRREFRKEDGSIDIVDFKKRGMNKMRPIFNEIAEYYKTH